MGPGKSNSRQKGKQGEALALEYLKKLGYRILAVNYERAGAEVDLIAIDRNELVAVEVKSGRELDGEFWEEKINVAKKRRIERALERFIGQNRMFSLPVRFEVIAVTFPGKEIQHFTEEFFE